MCSEAYAPNQTPNGYEFGNLPRHVKTWMLNGIYILVYTHLRVRCRCIDRYLQMMVGYDGTWLNEIIRWKWTWAKENNKKSFKQNCLRNCIRISNSHIYPTTYNLHNTEYTDIGTIRTEKFVRIYHCAHHYGKLKEWTSETILWLMSRILDLWFKKFNRNGCDALSPFTV